MRPLSAGSALWGPPLTLCDIIQRGYLSQVSLLVNLGISLDSRDASSRTPLMLTAFVHPEEWGVGVARLLIEAGIRMSPRDKQGMTVLHHACIYERLRLVQVLLNAPDFDLAQKDKFGNTALHYAAMSGNVALVKLLASHYRKYRLPCDTLNKQFHTAREEAAQRGYTICTDILVDVTSTSFHPTDNAQSLRQRSSSVVLFEKRRPHSGSTLKPSDNSKLSCRPALRPARTVVSQVSSPSSANDGSCESGDHNQNHSESTIWDSGCKSGDTTQNPFLPSMCDNKYVEDASTVIPKYNESEVIRITDLEKAPTSWNSQQVKTAAVLRERTDMHHNKEQNMPSIQNTSQSKLSTSQRSRREATSVSGFPGRLLPYEKDPDKVIYVASENDFRNTREFVLKLTRMTSTPGHFDTDCVPGLLSSTQANEKSNMETASGTWRDSIRFLYHRYEYQWTASWRKPAKLSDPSLLSAGEEKEEYRERKSRLSLRAGSQMSELSSQSLSRLRKLHASKRRGSNCSMVGAGCRSPVPDPATDNVVDSPSSTTPQQMSRKKLDSRASHGSIGDAATQANNPKATLDSRNSPSPDNSSRTFITHNQSNNSDVTSAGNGSCVITRDSNFRQGTSMSYPMPAVMESLVTDGEANVQEANAEPAEIDTSKLHVFSDVDDDDD